MFNVVRPQEIPECLTRDKNKQYNDKEVVDILAPLFHYKCYLCERDELFDSEIEHFDPHEKDESKKYDWHNLYYACSRCNSLKSNKHKELLDCCDPDIDIFKTIKCTFIPCEPIKVTAENLQTDIKTQNTVKLLNRCYNEDNTALRSISKIHLNEKILEYYTHLLNQRLILKNKKSTDTEKQNAKEKIAVMLKTSFPFSVFWRWHVLSDSFLAQELKDYINF